MDLYAYAQIENLEKVAKDNGIEVPRLRGYRLMVNEECYTEQDINQAIKSQECWIYEKACTSEPRFRPNSCSSELSLTTDRLKNKYLIYKIEKDGDYEYKKVVGFRWGLIHGKNKKAIKLAIKQGKKKVIKQLKTFNKYVSRPDVLYIHARIGGGNWSYFGGAELEKQPWFLEKVDDYFDSSYCDIYALIK